MHRSLEETATLPDIVATLEALPFFSEWAGRHSENYHNKMVEAYEYHLGEESKTVSEYQPLNPVSNIDIHTLPPIPRNYKKVLQAYRDLKGYPVTPLHDVTHKVLAAMGRGRHVLDIGCGLEKSVGASVLAATTRSEYPVWLICEHHGACHDTLTRLEEMGVDMETVAYIPGFNASTCERHEEVLDAGYEPNDIYNHMSTPCRGCTFEESCDFARRLFHFKDRTKNRIVVMTHSMFILKFEPWGDALTQWGFTPETLVIIDEQLRRWETGSFSVEDIRAALQCSGVESEPIMRAITEAVEGTGTLDTGEFIIGGVGILSDEVGVNGRSQAIRALNSHAFDEDTLNTYIEIITLLASNKIHYIMQNEKIHILTDRNTWSMPENCIMLDGSARFTQVKWSDFKFWRLKTPDYSGLTVHVMRGNPTKSNMRRVEEEFNRYVDRIRGEVKPLRVVHAVNKTQEGGKPYEPADKADMVASRGTDTRGSNEFIGCDMIVLRMALFTDINDYALRAALGSGVEIPVSEIWKKTADSVRPNMHKSGFVNPSLQIAAHRQIVDELYQAILRTGVRRYDSGTYTAVCMLPDDLSVSLLRDLLPGAGIVQHNFTETTNRCDYTVEAKRRAICRQEAVKRAAEIKANESKISVTILNPSRRCTTMYLRGSKPKSLKEKPLQRSTRP